MTTGRRGTRLAIEGGEPLRADFLPFGRPSITEDEVQAVADVLRSGWLGMGRRTRDFEEAFAEYVGAAHAVAVSSCTAALHLSLLARGVGPGDEVVTTPMTFAATINAILTTGATPVLVDVDGDTLNITPEAVGSVLTERTRAVLPVHFGGLACDLAGLGELADAHDLTLVEDAAHAVGATRGGVRVGGHGNLTCFSFYPNKNITTVEGGMISTHDGELAERLRKMRLHGLTSDAWKRYSERQLIVSQVVELGFKYNLTDLQSVLGISQLARVEENLVVRERHAALYDEALADLPLERQQRPPLGGADRHGLHLYVVLLDESRLRVSRDEVVRALRAENIGVGLHYQAVHEHPFYAELLPYAPGQLPVAERISASTMTLPLGPSLTDADARQVADAVRLVLEHYAA